MLNSPPPAGFTAPTINQQGSSLMGRINPHNMARPGNFSNAFSNAMPALSQGQGMNPQMAMIMKMLQQGGGR